MKFIKYLYCFTLFILAGNVSAQQLFLQGKILGVDNGKTSVLPGAIIIWDGTHDVTLSDEEGNFKIPISVELPHKLVVSFVGYRTDSVLITSNASVEIKIFQSLELKAAEVVAKREPTEISTLKTRNTETITEGEILKAACCNLSESFETNPSVDVNYSDGITGAKEIQMLGLSSIYTQTLTENIPNIRGLGESFGFAFVPGPWIESIQISKGAGSVTNGYEAVTGQVNVEFKKAEDAPPLFLNVFGDTDGRFEFNSILTVPLKKGWSYMLMVNANTLQKKNDNNNDGFLDAPLIKQANVYNRFRYHSGKRLEAQIGVKGITDDRIGGQTSFDPNTEEGTTLAYGFRMQTKRVEFYTKTGIVYPATPYKSIGLQTSFIWHEETSYFGLNTYDGKQGSAYLNYLYLTMIGNTDHKFKTGIDYKYDSYRESYNDSGFNRIESVPGIYGEYSYSSNESKFGMIAGARVDYNSYYGWLFTPRINLKYNFTQDLILRVSGGRGYRSPNVYADNIGLLASARKLVVAENPELEDGWNAGINLTTHFVWMGRGGSLSADVYHTAFSNQLVVDRYSQNNSILYYNLKGSSYANSMQLTFTYEVIERLKIKVAYKIDDTYTDYQMGNSLPKPLISKNKSLFDVSYADQKGHWRFNTTLQWEGAKPLPSTADYLYGTNESEDFSPDYFQLLAQITKVFKKWELYVGGENLLNYKQPNPIIGADNPFGGTFDATRIWGPIMGLKIFAGIRWTIH